MIWSVAPLHSFGQGDLNEAQFDVLVMSCHQHWIWHYQWNHYIPYVKIIKRRHNITFLVMWYHYYQCQSHGAKDTINGPTAFLGSRWSKWVATWLFWSFDAISIGLVSGDPVAVINCIFAFFRSTWSKWATWPLGHVTQLASVSWDTNGTVSVI